jgi:hypothetical protein
MSKYGVKSTRLQERLFMAGLIFTMVLLFIVLSQPVWNAKHLIQQQTNDCKKVGGVQVIDHGMFGDTYSCQPRLDRGGSEGE